MNISDRSAAMRTINSYLASQNLATLKHPLPSGKDITDTLKFLLQRLGFASKKLDEDLIHVLKFLKIPLKLNKSALKVPGTPDSWPSLLAVIHWLVQIVKYDDFLMDSSPDFESNKMFMYTINGYKLFIRGDDDELDALDEKFIGEMREWRGKKEENLKALEENVKELELKLEGLKGGPSRKEVLEQEKAVQKFHIVIEQLDAHLVDVQKELEEKERALEAKVEDRKRICEENEELKKKKKKIEEQLGINLRDAERMKRELQAVERDIEETEAAINGWEEKIWELHSEIGHKFNELEWLVMECNHAIRRLKLGNGFQYQLNAKGSTPSEVLGSEYRSTLKPALAPFAEDIKRSSIGKLEELISLRQKSDENAAKLEAVLQSNIDEVEAQLNRIRRETHDEYASRGAAQNMSVVEKEAEEFLKMSKAELLETITQTDNQLKLCAQKLFELINSVATHKEHVGSKIARMRNDLLETAGAVPPPSSVLALHSSK